MTNLSLPNHMVRGEFIASEYERWCDEARRLFPGSALQNLSPESAIRCQSLLGHGNCFGVWETPDELVGRRQTKFKRCVDIRKRLRAHLSESVLHSDSLDSLIEEGVLLMTRYALLLRLEPAGYHVKGRPLDVTTIAKCLNISLPKIYAIGIERRLTSSACFGFACVLTSDDLVKLRRIRDVAPEVNRMRRLADQGLWKDAPAKANIKLVTNPKGEAIAPLQEHKAIPYPPIPDDYLARMGPCVLWLVQDLGPNILHLLEAIPELFGDIPFDREKSHAKAMQSRLRRYFTQNTWHDRSGHVILAPPFRLRIGSMRGSNKARAQTKIDPYAWPPFTLGHIWNLGAILQSAHLWIALLAMAGRITEIGSLKRDCIVWARDGKAYANGKTYKLSAALAGEKRDWPAPEVLVQTLAQQVRLVCASEQIARQINGFQSEDPEKLIVNTDHLWASLGTSGTADPEAELAGLSNALQKLAVRTGFSPMPGGKALHPHRFRKTIARLAGIAIVDSPRVLMKLFGHKDISMTLHYILADKTLQMEIDQVAKELRILRCKGLLEDIHTAQHTFGSPKYGGHGGGGASVLAGVVGVYEEELHREGRQWDADSAYELSLALTNGGRYFRVTRPGVICIKESSMAGPCSCDSSCSNRIEDRTARRDVREIIPVLIAEGKRALAENQMLLLADKMQQLEEELARFDDINAEFIDCTELVTLRKAVA